MRQMRVIMLVFGITLIGIVGCGGEGAGNVLVGKVTYNNKPVSGTITFFGKGNSVAAPIDPDGSYKLQKLEAGLNQITLEGTPGIKGDSVLPPKKYATKGFLTYDVKPGKNSKDFALEP